MCRSAYCIGKVKESRKMKPRTKIEREVLALRPRLKKCWRSRIREARELFTIHGYYSRRRSLVWCEKCGRVHHQEFPQMGTLVCLNEDEYRCPHCGASLIVDEVQTWSKLPVWNAKEFCYVTHIDGWSVVRSFYRRSLCGTHSCSPRHRAAGRRFCRQAWAQS